MAKNPNGKSMKRESSIYGAFFFFFAACVAELFLMLVRKYYIKGTIDQVLAWHDSYLPVITGVSLAVLALGVVLMVLWKADKKKRVIGWRLGGAGAFFAVGSLLIHTYQESAVTLLSIVVPVVMVVCVLWAFYDRECSVSLTLLCATLIVLWVCRRVYNHMTLGLPVKAASVVYILLLGGVAWLAREGKLKRFFPAGADMMPLYIACGVSAAGVLVALLSAAAAYYAMWCTGVVVFALAVYYTVKQL